MPHLAFAENMIIPGTLQDAVVASLIALRFFNLAPHTLFRNSVTHNMYVHFDWGLDGRAFTDCEAIAAETFHLPCPSD